MRKFLEAVDLPDVVERFDGGREPPMNAEKTVVDQSCETHTVEHFHAATPHVDRSVLLQTLVIEAIHLTDLTTLVIPTKQGDTLRISNFQSQQQQTCLNTVVTSINIISHEDVIDARTDASHAEELAEVIELPVNITTDLQVTKHKHYEQ